MDKWMEKEFIEKYKILIKRDNHLEYLKGWEEISNREKGLLEFINPPKMITTGTGETVKTLAEKWENNGTD